MKHIINLNILFCSQGLNQPQWHVVLLECLRWVMHAAGAACSVAQMLQSLSFGTLSIPQRKQITLLQSMWWSMC